MSETVYAVVDIETTGTNPKRDRIIQIGCAFIQQGEIIHTYVQDIHPGIDIPHTIQQLTHITNEQVAHAPLLEEVAKEIYQLLQGTTFVAHNVFFDYQFLKQELLRCGCPELQLKAIDTVELTQIFYPTLPSYRLSDLAQQFQLSHERPHQADSDALATAQLFLEMEEKIKQLPLTTLEKIVELADVCAMDTQDYLEQLVKEQGEHIPPLREDLCIVKGIALKKPESIQWQEKFYETQEAVYPISQADKQEVYQDQFEYREGQSQMMDQVYRFFTSSKKNLALEAATGSGKTFGYLFPLSYLATKQEPVIISTVSVLLEQQILKKTVPMINQLRPGSLVATLLKSHQHYLDLTRFMETLRYPVKQKQYQLYQMGVLVWLTETKTGDLEELNLRVSDHLFLKHVRHRGLKSLDAHSPFYNHDFWLAILNQMKESNVLIVNHAFLAEESHRQEKILPSSPYLVIDEAHHLPDILEKNQSRHYYGRELSQLVQRMLHFSDETPYYGFEDIKEDPVWQGQIVLQEKVLTELKERLIDLTSDVYDALTLDYGYQEKEEIMLTNERMLKAPAYLHKELGQIEILLQEGLDLFGHIRKIYQQTKEKWLVNEQVTLTAWLDFTEELTQLLDFLGYFTQEQPASIIRWVYLSGQEYQWSVHYTDLTSSQVEESTWYQQFQHILYTGGTLSVPSDPHLLGHLLGMDDLPVTILPSPYDYKKQAKLYVPKEAFKEEVSKVSQYGKYVAQVIQDLATHCSKSLLVLFTSHQLIQLVYQHLPHFFEETGSYLLAQGISGTKERILKEFTQKTPSVLLGTDTYWEGVDLPGSHLEILVVTRLPFEPPMRPFVKEKYAYLASQQLNPFKSYALPKATLRMRQGLGRLIRSKEDKGVMIVLDHRLIDAHYSSQILDALPKELPVEVKEMKEMMKEIIIFLES